MSKLPKVIAIVGPTASGKTGLGIALAKLLNGEVVNCDSRQVYKEMDIGTAKPVGEDTGDGKYVVDAVQHHLMDYVQPDEEYGLARFKQDALVAINNILARQKLPIMVGGTGLYLRAVVDNLDIPAVPPNSTLRDSLSEKSLEELIDMLKKIDPESAGQIDLKNPRRILRALEVAIYSGQSFSAQTTKSAPLYDVLQIGLNWPREELYDRINRRCDEQIEAGLLEEAKTLVRRYAWTLPSMSGIGYRQMGYFLRDEMSWERALEVFKRDSRNYAKRQMTWFKKDGRICWIERDSLGQALKPVREFLA